MKLKKAMAVMMAAGMVYTAQPVWAEGTDTVAAEETTADTESEADAKNTAAEDTEDTGISADAAAQAQKLDTYYTLALNAINSEDYETANKYLDICFAYCDPQTDPVLYADLMLKRACIDVINEDTDIALYELDAALRIQPDLADAYLVRTQIYTALGEFSTAVENLEKYIELTEDTSLYETVAQLHEANGDLDQAAAAYNKYVEGSGEEIQEAGFQNGLYLMEGQKYDEAIEAFQAYTDDETYGAGAMYNIGICWMNLEDYAQAVEAFTACAEKEGRFDGLYYNRGVSYLMIGNWEEAEADFVKSAETESYASDAQYNQGICRMQMQDYEGAIADFTELIGDGLEIRGDGDETEAEAGSDTEQTEAAAAEPEEAQTGAAEEAQINPGAYYYRAVCLGAVGDLKHAIADYTTCIDNGYELAQSYYQRAQVYAALGDTENQTSDLQASLKYAE